MRNFIYKIGFLLIKIGWWMIEFDRKIIEYPGMCKRSTITVNKNGFDHFYVYGIKDKDYIGEE